MAYVSPSTLPAGGGTITLSGFGFDAGTTASVGGITCGSPTVVDISTMTCVAPAASAGTVADLVVTSTNYGSQTLTGAVTYNTGIHTGALYDYSGTEQTFVPGVGQNYLYVKMWGGGGAGAINTGGGGGYASGVISVTPGEQLSVITGSGGSYASPVGPGNGGFGGGGNGGFAYIDGIHYGSAGGGGGSFIKRNGTVLMAAGGGGGGGYAGVGGGGGGNVGVAGDGGRPSSGGTQSAGGAAGGSSLAGSVGVGGDGGTIGNNWSSAGGGGGGGYYGGGGGNGGGGDNSGSGGSGGSGFVSGLNTTTLSGSGALPGGAADISYQTGTAVGGASGTSGGDGLVMFVSTIEVTSVSPSIMDKNGGSTLTLGGFGFDAGTTITVGGSACTSVNVVNITSVSCTAPAGTLGSKPTIAISSTAYGSASLTNMVVYGNATVSTVTSCHDIFNAVATAVDGIYTVDPDAALPVPPMQVYCDMTNGGWTLVAGTDGSTTSTPVVSSLTSAASAGILSATYLQPLAASASSVRITVGGQSGTNFVSTSADTLAKLRAYQVLNDAAMENANPNTDWSPTSPTNMIFNCTPNGGYNEVLSANIYHACGNGTNGLHWLPGSIAEWSYGGGTSTLNLWVK